MRRRSNPMCPCLRQQPVATCSADTDAVRIPPQEYVARFCLTDAHRRCDVFRRHLGMRLAEAGSDTAKPRETSKR